MVEWKHITGFGMYESYYTSYQGHTITILKLKEDKAYTYVWGYHDKIEAEITFQADNWDAAKAYAFNSIKKRLDEKAKFWRDVKISFTNWTEER